MDLKPFSAPQTMKKIASEFLPVLLFGIFVSVLLTFPFVLRMTTLYSDSGDYSLIGWMLWHSSNALTDGSFLNRQTYFNASQFYPFPYSLAFSENLFLPAVLFTPVYLITKNLSLAVNSFALFTLVATFVSAFYVILYFIKNRYAAIVGAVIFTFNPVSFAHFPGHLHLSSKFFLPLLFLFSYRLLTRPNIKDAFWFGLISMLNALTGIHFGVFAITFIPLFALPFIIYPLFKENYGLILKFIKYSLIIFVFVPFVYYLYSPYLEFSKKEGVVRSMFESASYSAKPIDYISTLPNNLVYGEFVKGMEDFRGGHHVMNYAEHSLSLNLIPFVLFLLGILRLKNSKLPVQTKLFFWGLSIVGVASIILSFGPVYRGWVLPYYHINYWLHLFDGLRVPSRFQIVFYMPFAVFCAYGFLSIYERYSRKLIYVFSIVLFLIFLENINVQEFTERSKHIPASQNPQLNYSQFTFLKDKQTLHLPTHYDKSWLQNEYLNLVTISNEKTLNGYSGYFPMDWVDLLAGFERRFDNGALKKLKAMGVQYVIVHKTEIRKDFYERFLKEEFISPYRYFENEFYLILSLENLNIRICNLNNDIDFLLNPYQKSFGDKTTFFYRLTIKNMSDCYLPSVLQNRYLERNFYFNGKIYTQSIRMPIVMEPFEQVIKK